MTVSAAFGAGWEESQSRSHLVSFTPSVTAVDPSSSCLWERFCAGPLLVVQHPDHSLRQVSTADEEVWEEGIRLVVTEGGAVDS